MLELLEDKDYPFGFPFEAIVNKIVETQDSEDALVLFAHLIAEYLIRKNYSETTGDLFLVVLFKSLKENWVKSKGWGEE